MRIKATYRRKQMVLDLEELVDRFDVDYWTEEPPTVRQLKGRILTPLPADLKRGTDFEIRCSQLRAKFILLTNGGEVQSNGAYALKT
jgi:hypothetical protein